MNSQPNRVLPVLYGSLIMTTLAVFPLINLINVFCCAGIAAGGFAGAYFYSRQLQGTGIALTTKDGVMTGMLSGILSAVVVSGFTVMAGVFSQTNPINEMLAMFDEAGISMPPEMLTQAEKFTREYDQYGFSPTIAVFSFVIHLILFPAFGAIGAMIFVTAKNRKNSSGIQQ